VPTIAITPKLTPTPTPTAVTLELFVGFAAADVGAEVVVFDEVAVEVELAFRFPGPGRTVRRGSGSVKPDFWVQHVTLAELQHQVPSAH
jgi:hypothetical protein